MLCELSARPYASLAGKEPFTLRVDPDLTRRRSASTGRWAGPAGRLETATGGAFRRGNLADRSDPLDVCNSEAGIRIVMDEPRRFFAPWRAVEFEGVFRIEDAAALPLAYAYYSEDTARRAVGGYMSRDDARRIALNITALPDLRAALREKDGAGELQAEIAALRAQLAETEQERDAWRAEAERLGQAVA